MLHARGGAVQEVVRHDAVRARADAGHQAYVARPRRADDDGRHAVGDGPALGKATQDRRARGRIVPVEVCEAVDADQDDARHRPMIADAGAFRLAPPNGMIRPFISSDWSTRTSSARKRGGEQPVPKDGLPGDSATREHVRQLEQQFDAEAGGGGPPGLPDRMSSNSTMKTFSIYPHAS